MMHGVVNTNCEATISLVIGNENRQTQLIEAVIDTGYAGGLLEFAQGSLDAVWDNAEDDVYAQLL
jgi:hypothetical protein